MRQIALTHHQSSIKHTMLTSLLICMYCKPKSWIIRVHSFTTQIFCSEQSYLKVRTIEVTNIAMLTVQGLSEPILFWSQNNRYVGYTIVFSSDKEGVSSVHKKFKINLFDFLGFVHIYSREQVLDALTLFHQCKMKCLYCPKTNSYINIELYYSQPSFG